LHFARNRLSPSSTRAFLCLGSWLRTDLIVVEEVVSIVKQSKKRKVAEMDPAMAT
ncbi:hypothetical protein SCLCIDRAFT_137680, partial [Scleroderma citrinum Foug A]